MQISMVVANLIKVLKWLREVEGKMLDVDEVMTFGLMKKPLAAKIVPHDFI